MKVLLIGQKAFGADVLKAYLEKPIELVGAIVGTNDLEKEDAVEAAAREANIDCIKVNSLKTADVKSWVEAKKPDLIAMAFVTLYMPMDLVQAAPLGAINFHPSLLPLHRGISALPWTILCGDKTAGLSVYFIDGGMDTGDVIVQKSVEIGDDDFKDLYFKKIYPLGIQAMCEAIDLILTGNPPRVKQDDALATSEPKLKREHLLIHWSGSSEEILRKVRAGNPGIGASAEYRGREVRIFAAGRCDPGSTDSAPGTVISLADGICVRTGDGAVCIKTISVPPERKMSAQAFAEKEGLKAGSSFADGQI